MRCPECRYEAKASLHHDLSIDMDMRSHYSSVHLAYAPYWCQYCREGYSSREKLYYHIKRCHPRSALRSNCEPDLHFEELLDKLQFQTTVSSTDDGVATSQIRNGIQIDVENDVSGLEVGRSPNNNNLSVVDVSYSSKFNVLLSNHYIANEPADTVEQKNVVVSDSRPTSSFQSVVDQDNDDVVAIESQGDVSDKTEFEPKSPHENSEIEKFLASRATRLNSVHRRDNVKSRKRTRPRFNSSSPRQNPTNSIDANINVSYELISSQHGRQKSRRAESRNDDTAAADDDSWYYYPDQEKQPNLQVRLMRGILLVKHDSSVRADPELSAKAAQVATAKVRQASSQLYFVEPEEVLYEQLKAFSDAYIREVCCQKTQRRSIVFERKPQAISRSELESLIEVQPEPLRTALNSACEYLQYSESMSPTEKKIIADAVYTYILSWLTRQRQATYRGKKKHH